MKIGVRHRPARREFLDGADLLARGAAIYGDGPDAEALASLRVLVDFFRWRGDTETADALDKLARRFAIDHVDGNFRNNALENCRVVWIGENGRG